ncbi:hypothetical protein ABFX02_08G191400 [Erythranthe guttata]
MANSLLRFFLLLSFTLLSAANHRKPRSIFRSPPLSESTTSFSASSAAAAAPPTTYFEVTKPIPLPKTLPCSIEILRHEFAYTYGKSPVLAEYKPPSNCASRNSLKIVLELTAASKGRQFDRIFGVWLGGVEILRSCTAEPRRTGIVWTVKKDITRYRSLLMKEQTLAVYIGNIIDNTYTGVYHVNLTIHFYPVEEQNHGRNGVISGDDVGSMAADLILPVSRNLPLNDGLWFEIESSTHVLGKEIEIPQNTYRAVLEVYVSPHENDEFWYTNYLNEYIYENNLTDSPGNGPFREVVVRLDDSTVGSIWPFTVIYTGGVNPFLWRPISGIGSFDLPSYDIEITPFLGTLLDGKNHSFTFSVTNALNVWYIDANLHLWLDEKSDKTHGKLLKHSTPPLSLSLVSSFSGANGVFTTNVSRSIVSSGWVKSSHGVITTKSRQEFRYCNSMAMKHDGNLQVLDQMIYSKGSVDARKRVSSVFRDKLFRRFRIYLSSDDVDKGNGTLASTVDLRLSIDEKSRRGSCFGSWKSRMKNRQKGHGYMLLKDSNLVDGLGETQQDYRYSSDESCYFRNVRSSNYTILHDEDSNTCKNNEP